MSHPRRRRQGGRGCAVLIQHEQFPSARASRRSNHNTSSVTTTHFLIYIYTYLRTYFTRVIKVELNQQPPNMQQQAWRGSGLPQCRAGTPCSDMSRTKEYICTGYICSLTVSSSADLCPAQCRPLPGAVLSPIQRSDGYHCAVSPQCHPVSSTDELYQN